jgi:Ca-activated chloride channel homolog
LLFVRYACMRFWLNLFFVALSGAFHAQTLTFDKVKHDFGNLESYDLRYVDFKLKNTGAKKEWILSVKKPQELIYMSSKQFIDKDSTGILRFQVNPKTKGKFAYDVEVYTSDRAEPVKLKIVGNLLELDLNEGNSLTDCPDFNARPGGVDPNQFKLKVITVDESTREVLSNSSVSLIQNGRESWTKRTDKDGEIREEGTIGFSYFYATHEGYFPAELGAYINHNRNTIVLKLKKGELVLPPVDTTTVVFVPETPIPELIGELPPSFTDLDRDNFDPKYFKPVNVVFVLDISSSMKQADKMELMKYSLAQLTSMLRPEDKITLVTYSSDAQVYMRALSGADKDKIYEKVEELTAYGFTAGGTGIKLGFKEANKHFLPEGENQVVIITDGAFNRDSDDYLKSVKRFAKKGIRFSVVGIRNKDVDKEKMQESAEKGKGFYVSVMNLGDAQQNLKQAIRLVAFKRN